jgi:hypothetical protein
VVLFSPAAPTPDGDGGYRQRSRQFISAIGLPGERDPTKPEHRDPS